MSRAHLVVGLDGSESSRRAASLSVELARRLGGRVTFLCVIFSTSPSKSESRLPAADDPFLEEQHRVAHGMVEAERAKYAAAGVDIESCVVMGKPSAELARACGEERDALILVGRSGQGFVSRAILGSVCNQLTQSSPVPVLIVP